MRKKNVMKGMWKRVVATSLAAMLAFGGLDFGAVSLVAKAESTNLFVDGDFGDDDTDDFWNDGNWSFEGTTWDAADDMVKERLRYMKEQMEANVAEYLE